METVTRSFRYSDCRHAGARQLFHALGAVGLTVGVLGAGLALSGSPARAADDVQLVPGDPIAVYTRIARGIRRCWFGADGVFSKAYLFRAVVPPPSRGGETKIGIYTKNPKGRLGRLVIQAELSKSGEDTKIAISSRGLSSEADRIVKARVAGWSRLPGGPGFRGTCGEPGEAVVLLASGVQTAENVRLSTRTSPPLPRRTGLR